MSSRQKIIAFIMALGLLLIGIFTTDLYSKNPSDPQISQPKASIQDNNGVKVLSTNPSPLEAGIISPTQTLEITFNKPLVRDNTRIVLEPKANYNTDLSPDHKTLKIIPNKSFDLGKDYTLTIKSGYGTDTGEKLDHDEVFHFKTIEYKGV